MKYFPYVLLFLFMMGCSGPEPRKPIKVKTGRFFKESIARNRELLAAEEKRIKDIIAKDTLHSYDHTASGSWFYYNIKNDGANYTPKPNDVVTMTYNVLSLDNDTIYSKEDIGVIQYKVDKQELFPGLRNSVKLLKENETATFLFPSSLAYGYHGDNNRIGVNVPIKSTISLLEIERIQDSLP